MRRYSNMAFQEHDTDNDGVIDRETVTGPDGQTLTLEDLDGDGTMDRLTRHCPDGAKLAVAERHGDGTETRTLFDSNGNVVEVQSKMICGTTLRNTDIDGDGIMDQLETICPKGLRLLVEDTTGDGTGDRRTEFDGDGKVVSVLQRRADGTVTMTVDGAVRTFGANGEIGATPPEVTPSAPGGPVFLR